MRATVLGLGEAGSLYATGLVARGWSVTGLDPADTATPPGIARAATAQEAVRDADVVLSLVGGRAALSQVADHPSPSAGSRTVSTVAVAGIRPSGRASIPTRSAWSAGASTTTSTPRTASRGVLAVRTPASANAVRYHDGVAPHTRGRWLLSISAAAVAAASRPLPSTATRTLDADTLDADTRPRVRPAAVFRSSVESAVCRGSLLVDLDAEQRFTAPDARREPRTRVRAVDGDPATLVVMGVEAAGHVPSTFRAAPGRVVGPSPAADRCPDTVIPLLAASADRHPGTNGWLGSWGTNAHGEIAGCPPRARG